MARRLECTALMKVLLHRCYAIIAISGMFGAACYASADYPAEVKALAALARKVNKGAGPNEIKIGFNVTRTPSGAYFFQADNDSHICATMAVELHRVYKSGKTRKATRAEAYKWIRRRSLYYVHSDGTVQVLFKRQR